MCAPLHREKTWKESASEKAGLQSGGKEENKIKSCHCCLHWNTPPPKLKALVCESVCVPSFSLFRVSVIVKLTSKDILKFTTRPVLSYFGIFLFSCEFNMLYI